MREFYQIKNLIEILYKAYCMYWFITVACCYYCYNFLFNLSADARIYRIRSFIFYLFLLFISKYICGDIYVANHHGPRKN